MFYKDNWLSWSYNGITRSPKKSLTADFNIHLTQTIHKSVGSYHEELFNHARNIRDTIDGKFDLLFSGGIDSEVILRVYKDLGVPLNVYIFKYENDLNYKEYNCAIKICKELNVPYKSIDFNVQKFFENDAYDVWTKCYANSSGWLPHMKMTEYLDNIPVFGSGDPYWRKQNDGSWKFELDEGAKFWTLYHVAIGRVALCDWYEYSPELIISHMQLPKIDNLINDRIPGKLSSFSHKHIIHKDIWNDIEIRNKMVGFEKDQSPGSKPKFMLEFEEQYINRKVESKIFRYSKEELRALLCSY